MNGVLTQALLYGSQLRPAAELDGSGAVVARFVYGTRINVPDYLVKAGVTYRLLTDHLGSVRLVLDAATGTVAQRLDYDDFGQITQDTNPGFQPFGFAGGLYDPDTKLTRFGARDYDAFTGRWMTKDPIGFKGRQINLYEYAHTDPINWIDSSGHQSDCPREKVCLGRARVLQGNPTHIGRAGAFNPRTITETSAAVIPQQFGVAETRDLRPHARSIGGILGGTQFSDVADVVGPPSARERLQQLNPEP